MRTVDHPELPFIARTIRERRKSLGFSLERVAGQVRDASRGACLLTYDELGKLERGELSPQVGKLLWIAQALDLSVDLVALRSP